MIETERGRQRLPEQYHPESLMSPPMHPAPGALPKCDFLPLSQPAQGLAARLMCILGYLEVSLIGTKECWPWQSTVSCFWLHTTEPTITLWRPAVGEKGGKKATRKTKREERKTKRLAEKSKEE
ncbi:hypothetical protein ATANTOWER_018001 [Ataeniobius toweri]|uniref:Uncharacterized protein n=1 Tax=Ataeniobius toweri TaxID=208326 RepID=A0ABU7BX88_9TELE|nr:hypothetical protein [Ataeniobius toweri]